MDLKKYKGKLDNLIRANGVLTFVLIGSFLLNGYLTNVIVTRSESQKTVFVPPQVTYKEFWIDGNDSSKSYKEGMGTFVAYSLLNVTKHNVDTSITNILPLVASEHYTSVRVELTKNLNYIVNNSISRTFYLGSIETSKKGLIVVNGSIVDSISKKISDTKRVELNISYKMVYGKFEIKEIKLFKVGS